MKILDVTNREVEKKLGQSYGYLSRLFAGTIDLKMDHVLDVCQAIGLHPAEFFHIAYPRIPAPTTDSAQRLREVLQGFQPHALFLEPGAAAPLSLLNPQELDRMMLESLRRLITEVAKQTL